MKYLGVFCPYLRKISITLLFFGTLFSQSRVSFFHALYEKGLYNPSAVVDESASISFVHRNQWVGVAKNPKTFAMHTQFYLGDFTKVPLGLGISYQNDALGSLLTQNLQLALAYKTDFMPKKAGFFALGVSMLADFSRYNDAFLFPNGTNFEPLLAQYKNTQKMDMSLGVQYKAYQDLFSLGFSAQRFLGFEKPLLSAFAQYQLNLQNKETLLSTQHVLRFKAQVFSDTQNQTFDVASDYYLMRWVYLGVSYRYYAGFGFYLGLEKMQKIAYQKNLLWQLGYAYIPMQNKNGLLHKGSHEIFFRLSFSRKNISRDNYSEDQDPTGVESSRYHKYP